MKKAKQPLPFNRQLGSSALQRVRKPFAQRAWSLGLPVWLDAGNGAVLLERPASVPSPGKKQGFEDANLKAAGKDRRTPPAIPRGAIWLVPYGPMCLHFVFDDKSNPFVKYGTVQELACELESWSVRWRMKPFQSERAETSVAHFSLAEKNPPPKGLFTGCP